MWINISASTYAISISIDSLKLLYQIIVKFINQTWFYDPERWVVNWSEADEIDSRSQARQLVWHYCLEGCLSKSVSLPTGIENDADNIALA